MRLVAWLHLDPLGELIALPQPPSWIKGERGGEWEMGRGGRGRGGKREGEVR